MRTILLALAASAMLAGVSQAQTLVDDPLHGQCVGCVDTGSVTPLPPGTTQFGFSISPANGQPPGEFYLEVLVPTNEFTGASPVLSSLKAPFAIGTDTLVPGAFVSGTLEGFVSSVVPGLLGAQPNNPLGGLLDPNEFALDPTATGFKVFLVDVGNTAAQTLPGPSVTFGTTGFTDEFQLGANLPIGSYILGALVPNDGSTAVDTALSGALLVQQQASPVPEPATLSLFGIGLIGIGLANRRRQARQAAV